MLVFIDESGDPGLKIDKGSSRFFVIGLVIFEDNDEAAACDQRIELLKRELGKQPSDEFHFKTNLNRVKETFLKAVSPYNFFYYGIVINKDPKKLYGEGFKNKESFYKYACGLVFENAKEKLRNSIIIIDKSGNLDFRNQLGKYLRRKMNGKDRIIKKIKMQRSESNNLLQLADYIAGVIYRSVRNERKKADDYRKIIAHREIYVQIWPK
ncbi:MAG: DUF3800 domain-containing protein [Candidatus Nealsonbacteria bacterium DGGOD1a]|nr:MAG: DUF3800 domain-containing protein [Candidatus Nealsonbacteria bacterium DGGOD1a]